MLELKPLSYFVAAYEEGTLTAASNRCHIAQPSISHAIKTLEDRLDTQLFQRHKKGLVPTQPAHKLYVKAKALIEQSQLLEKQFGLQQVTELKVFVQADIQLTRFEHLFTQWQQNISNLSLNLVRELDQADIAFLDKEHVGQHWESITLENENYVVAIPSYHSLVSQSYIDLTDLHNLELIERPYCSRRGSLGKTFASLEIKPVLTAQAQNDHQLFELIKLGFGIGLVPEWSFTPQQGLAVKRFTTETYTTHPVAQREVVLAHRKSKHVVQTFIDSLAI